MKDFVSDEAAATLAAFRLAPVPATPGVAAPVRMLAALPSEDCGCPEELWLIDGLEVLMHFEADGSGEVFVDAGDWQRDMRFAARDMPDLRALVFRWIADFARQEDRA